MRATESKANARVLALIGYYLPGFRGGGPLRSMANLVDALGAEVPFRILTSDTDLGASQPYTDVATNVWFRMGAAGVMRLSPGLSGWLHLTKVLVRSDSHDILYLNSFFAVRYSIFPMLMRWLGVCRPACVIVAPRGEFSAGAIVTGRRLQKRVYIQLARVLRLYDSVVWQASSVFEAQDIVRQFPEVQLLQDADLATVQSRSGTATVRVPVIAVASNIPTSTNSTPLSRARKFAGTLDIVSVSRIVPNKNLRIALGLLAGLTGNVRFDIYGPVEDERYWEECQAVARTLPSNVIVRYLGKIEHEQVRSVFAAHDLLLFPTAGENFGHVIFESLAAGCPVLISDCTPWRNLSSEGVGWDVPLNDASRFQSILQKCIDMDAAQHSTMSARAIEYAAHQSSASDAVNAHRRMFNFALGRNALPEYVSATHTAEGAHSANARVEDWRGE